MSRLPLNWTKEDENCKEPGNIFHLKQINRLPVTVRESRKETRNNPILAKVIQAIMSGWPAKQQSHLDLLPHFHKRKELAVYDWCLLWGGRVIVPPKLQQNVLEKLHEGHDGIVKMKWLARSYLRWPGLDSQIERTCRTFLKVKGIKHLSSPPYHPRAKGLAGRFVRRMKEALKNDKGNASLMYKLFLWNIAIVHIIQLPTLKLSCWRDKPLSTGLIKIGHNPQG